MEKDNKNCDEYKIRYIVSDIVGFGQYVDTNVINPWGTAIEDDTIYIANNGSGTLINYCLKHYEKLNTINVTSQNPTGIVINHGDGFSITNNNITAKSNILIVSENGSLDGYNSQVDPFNTVPLLPTDSSKVFKGITITKDGKFIFITDFKNGLIYKYDDKLNLIISFGDNNLNTSGYAPFGINIIKNRVFVTYAKQDQAQYDDVSGNGNGYIDIYDLNGTLLRRFANRGHLNSPWALLEYNDFLLVGNFGNGQILKYDLHNGKFKGLLTESDTNNIFIQIDGLWNLNKKDDNNIFFTAGINGENNGVWGKLKFE